MPATVIHLNEKPAQPEPEVKKSRWQIASFKVLMGSISLITVTQGMYFSYLISTTTTLEKRFAYDGRLTGFILIADNISQLAVR